MGILIQGGRIVDAAADTDKKGDIYLEDGVITEIGECNAPLPTFRFLSFGGAFQPRTFSAQDLSTSELLRTL